MDDSGSELGYERTVDSEVAVDGREKRDERDVMRGTREERGEQRVCFCMCEPLLRGYAAHSKIAFEDEHLLHIAYNPCLSMAFNTQCTLTSGYRVTL